MSLKSHRNFNIFYSIKINVTNLMESILKFMLYGLVAVK
jgi:hypothetical protein